MTLTRLPEETAITPRVTWAGNSVNQHLKVEIPPVKVSITRFLTLHVYFMGVVLVHVRELRCSPNHSFGARQRSRCHRHPPNAPSVTLAQRNCRCCSMLAQGFAAVIDAGFRDLCDVSLDKY